MTNPHDDAVSQLSDADRPDVRRIDVRRIDVWRHPGQERADDDVAVEAPLEVRLNGQPFSVIMRTPGADRELALGFLFTERILRHRHELKAVTIGERGDCVDVELVSTRDAVVAGARAERRQVTMTSACGMCGRRSLDSLTVDAPPCPVEWSVEARIISSLPVVLQGVQSAFAQTGGLHAAALFDREGRLESSAEDVGRHNAVDKLLGRVLEAGQLPRSDSLLMVSGRSSFEIVQKAWLGGIPLVAAVSAPSSMAVDLAREAGMTLLGFVRPGRFNVYAHPSRVVA